MRLVALSDTHMLHDRVDVPACDLLIHAGDFTRRGSFGEMERFLAWLAAQPARDRVLIAGNHDFCCERDPAGARALCQRFGVTYLADEEVTLAGLRMWGSPVTPRFRDMAFNRDRGEPLRAHWRAIPTGIDLLVTHGPPRGLGDRAVLGRVGCDDLLARARELAPRLHVFGHIHEAHGQYRLPGSPTRFVNACVCKLWIGTRPATVLDL